jgi:7-keto-8-aminopelargonate synthetase-like enzyme
LSSKAAACSTLEAATIFTQVREIGLSLASSRMVTGNHPLCLQLEKVRAVLRVSPAVLTTVGYGTCPNLYDRIQ